MRHLSMNVFSAIRGLKINTLAIFWLKQAHSKALFQHISILLDFEDVSDLPSSASKGRNGIPVSMLQNCGSVLFAVACTQNTKISLFLLENIKFYFQGPKRKYEPSSDIPSHYWGIFYDINYPLSFIGPFLQWECTRWDWRSASSIIKLKQAVNITDGHTFIVREFFEYSISGGNFQKPVWVLCRVLINILLCLISKHLQCLVYVDISV